MRPLIKVDEENLIYSYFINLLLMSNFIWIGSSIHLVKGKIGLHLASVITGDSLSQTWNISTSKTETGRP